MRVVDPVWVKDASRVAVNADRPRRTVSRAVVFAGFAGAVLGAVAVVGGQAVFDGVLTDGELEQAYMAGYELAESGQAEIERQCRLAAAVRHPEKRGEWDAFHEGCNQAVTGVPADPATFSANRG